MSRRSRRGRARGAREQGSQIVCERHDGGESLCACERERYSEERKSTKH